LALLAGLSGCKKKKPTLPLPQAQAPDISRLPRPEQPEPVPPPQVPAGTTAHQKTAPRPAPKKKPAKKTAPAQNNHKKPQTRTEPQLSATLTPGENTSQRRSAAQLLDATDANLRSLNRSLSNDEQSMVQQIRTFMAQSRSAQKDGDTDRAYNLALKANLLSQELVKR
jgi:hypothetical protein